MVAEVSAPFQFHLVTDSKLDRPVHQGEKYFILPPSQTVILLIHTHELFRTKVALLNEGIG